MVVAKEENSNADNNGEELAKTTILEARLLISKKDYQLATEKLEAVLNGENFDEMHPQNAQLFYYYAQCLMEQAREDSTKDDSEQQLSSLLSKFANKKPLSTDEQGEDENEGQDDDIQAAWQNAEFARLQVEKNEYGSMLNIMILKLLAEINMDIGSLQTAIEDLEKASGMAAKIGGIKGNKEIYAIKLSLAQLFIQLHDYENAIKATNDAISVVDLVELDENEAKEMKNLLNRQKLEFQCQKAQNCPNREEEQSLSEKPKLQSAEVDITHLFEKENSKSCDAVKTSESMPKDFSLFNKKIGDQKQSAETGQKKEVKDVTNLIKKKPMPADSDKVTDPAAKIAKLA